MKIRIFNRDNKSIKARLYLSFYDINGKLTKANN